MKRLGFITDVHADVHALQDALAQMQRLGCTQVVCGGDLVDYGLFPEETLALLREQSIVCVQGNHDRWALGHGGAHSPEGRGTPRTHDASGWDLSQPALDFLSALPLKWDAVIEGVRIAVRHASPRSDMDGIYPEHVSASDAQRWLEQVNADVLLVGHTHIPFVLRTLGGGLIANPGALLRETGDPERPHTSLYDPELGRFVRAPAPGGGTFGVLELELCAFTIHRASDGALVEVPTVKVGMRDARDETR